MPATSMQVHETTAEPGHGSWDLHVWLSTAPRNSSQYSFVASHMSVPGPQANGCGIAIPLDDEPVMPEPVVIEAPVVIDAPLEDFVVLVLVVVPAPPVPSVVSSHAETTSARAATAQVKAKAKAWCGLIGRLYIAARCATTTGARPESHRPPARRTARHLSRSIETAR